MQPELAQQFSQQIAASHRIVLKICRMYGLDQEDRDDLRQEILLNAWRAFPQFRGEAKFSTWLYKVGLNTAIGRARKKRVTVQPLMAAHDHVPDYDSDKAEQLALLDRLVSQLTAQEKALVALYLDELSYQEMAEIMGLTENHIGVKLNRIKEKLKKLIKHEDRFA